MGGEGRCGGVACSAPSCTPLPSPEAICGGCADLADQVPRRSDCAPSSPPGELYCHHSPVSAVRRSRVPCTAFLDSRSIEWTRSEWLRPRLAAGPLDRGPEDRLA